MIIKWSTIYTKVPRMQAQLFLLRFSIIIIGQQNINFTKNILELLAIGACVFKTIIKISSQEG